MKYNVLSNLEHDKALYVPSALIELADDVAAKLIADGVIEELKERPQPIPVGTATDITSDTKAFEDMTAAELKEEAAKRDLPTSGTKADLIERLKTHVVDDDNDDL